MPVTIYHNPACGTSRNALQFLRENGIEPTIIEYLKTPPDRATLKSLLNQMDMKPRELIRKRGELYESLGLANPDLTDEQLIDAMAENPALIERPIVMTAKGTKLCRPWETVKTLV